VTRIALIGAGAMGGMHRAAWATMAGIEVVGLSGRDVAATRSLIESREIDAVDVCLPSALHASVVIPALAAGKHVFCETPLALTMDEAVAMRDSARQAGRLLQVGLLMRSIGAYAHLKAAVESGTHGRLLELGTWRHGSYLRPGAPDHKPHYGDPTTELMTFDFDVVGWLMGKPSRLSALPGDEVIVTLGFDDGRQATVRASGLMPADMPFTSGFAARFERAVFTLTTVFEGGPPNSSFMLRAGGAPPVPVAVTGGNPYEIELARFVECIAGRADPALLDADRALEALALSLATQRALAVSPSQAETLRR
jgi:UDP-N-acetylglucosamine 3-dehydrogenase